MNHILRSRKQKIEFLNGLRAGKNHVTEILPPGKYEVWFWIQEKGVMSKEVRKLQKLVKLIIKPNYLKNLKK